MIIRRPPTDPAPVDEDALSESITVGFTKADKARIRDEATRKGMSMSAWLRRAGLNQLDQPIPPGGGR